MQPVGAVYADGRRRLSELIAARLPGDGKQIDIPVVTCPRWSVHDVLAHVAGVCDDVLKGNIAGVATDPWTDAQVQARRRRSTAEVLEEWERLAPDVEAMAEHFPGRVGEQWVLDLTTHEHDIRTALDEPGARDSDAVSIAVGFVLELGFDPGLRARGLGPVEVRTDGRSWIVGGPDGDGDTADGEGGAAAAAAREMEQRLLADSVPEPRADAGPPVATLEAPAFDLVRALTGRRSAAQIAAMTWSTDPTPYLPAFQFGPFTTTAVDIPE